MAVPLAPIAGVVLRYGAVAAAGYAVARSAKTARRDQRAEDALDDTPEGLAWRKDGDQLSANGRFRRVIRVGHTGPAIEVDLAGWTRLRVRRVK